jgi:hypothetical protein
VLLLMFSARPAAALNTQLTISSQEVRFEWQLCTAINILLQLLWDVPAISCKPKQQQRNVTNTSACDA